VTTFHNNLINTSVETYLKIYQQATQLCEEGDQSNGQNLSIGLHDVRRKVKVYRTKKLRKSENNAINLIYETCEYMTGTDQKIYIDMQ
jgi:hypothetical protein